MTREALYHAVRFERQADQLEFRAQQLRERAASLRADAFPQHQQETAIVQPQQA